MLKLQDRYNPAQTVKETRQLHKFQPQGKIIVYNTSLQASPPTEGIIVKSISLSRVQIEDNKLQISSFVACTYDEKWWLGMVAQISYEFEITILILCIHQDMENNSIGLQKLTLVGHQTLCVSLKPQFCLLNHHGNTLLVRMTIKKYLKNNLLCNGTSWNISYIQFRQFNIYS